MTTSRIRKRTKRYIKELLHIFRFTYEDISLTSGIEVDRLKAISKSEEPTPEESIIIGKLALGMSKQRGKDTGEESD